MISLGLVGNPLRHSFSPKIHHAALNYLGMKGKYTLFSIPPSEIQALEDLLKRIRTGEIIGLNVTIPYKNDIIGYLDELSPTAKAIGAVNTIFLSDGKLSGENTDAQGFLIDFEKYFYEMVEEQVQSKNALILGAGGAARAVAYSLISEGWEVYISARRMTQAQNLKDNLPFIKNQITVVDYWENFLHSEMNNVNLVVNTTPVGMFPNINDSPYQNSKKIPKNAFIYDLVYNPMETKFIRDAQSSGLRAVSGIGMLVEQAALSFEIWTGQKVPRNILYKAIEEK